MTVTITARCVACKATRPISSAESYMLTVTKGLPTCETCGGVMVAESATAKLDPPQDGAA